MLLHDGKMPTHVRCGFPPVAANVALTNSESESNRESWSTFGAVHSGCRRLVIPLTHEAFSPSSFHHYQPERPRALTEVCPAASAIISVLF